MTQNFTVQFQAMGCTIQAWLNVPNAHRAGVLREVPLWFEGWEERFSRFRSTSELCALNASAGEWFAASAELCEVLWSALDMAALTGGLFNPLVLPALEAAGYTRSFTAADTFIPGDAPQNPPMLVPDWRNLRVDRHGGRIRLPIGARLDLGGIAKGWAAQQTANRLAHYGACLVDAGGDMVARGTPDKSGGWQVALPALSALSALPDHYVTLSDATIATSGVDYRHWQRDGRTLHHLIDPRTVQPAANDVLTATVIAPDAVEAEAWAKSTLIAGNVANNDGRPVLIVRTDSSVSYTQEFAALCPTILPATAQAIQPNPSAAVTAR